MLKTLTRGGMNLCCHSSLVLLMLSHAGPPCCWHACRCQAPPDPHLPSQIQGLVLPSLGSSPHSPSLLQLCALLLLLRIRFCLSPPRVLLAFIELFVTYLMHIVSLVQCKLKNRVSLSFICLTSKIFRWWLSTFC